MSNSLNKYQSRIGDIGVNGPAFPATESGDEIAVYAIPSHWKCAEGSGVGLVVNLHVATLTPREARRLARILLEHADQSEGVEQ